MVGWRGGGGVEVEVCVVWCGRVRVVEGILGWVLRVNWAVAERG